MTLLDSLRSKHPDLIVLDGGNFGEAVTGPSAWKAGEQLKLLKQVGYDAVCLGQNDLTAALAEAAKQAKAQDLLFSSLVPSKTKMTLPPAKIIARTGYKLGVLSLVSPGFNREANGSAPPYDVEAFLSEQLKAWAAQKIDFTAVVFLGPEEELLAIGRKHPEVDVWLLTQGRHQPIRLIENLGDALVVSGGDRGREVGFIKVEKLKSGERSAASFQQLILNDRIADSPKAAPLLESYRAAGRPAQSAPAPSSPPPPGGNGAASLNPFVGSQACQECHKAIFGKWKESAHAHAFATLVARNEQHNAQCLSCHTVGYREESGYTATAATAHLNDVGCESCHGRGGFHVRTQGRVVNFATTTPATCVRCHTAEWSPRFVFAEYVQRVH